MLSVSIMRCLMPGSMHACMYMQLMTYSLACSVKGRCCTPSSMHANLCAEVVQQLRKVGILQRVHLCMNSHGDFTGTTISILACKVAMLLCQDANDAASQSPHSSNCSLAYSRGPQDVQRVCTHACCRPACCRPACRLGGETIEYLTA